MLIGKKIEILSCFCFEDSDSDEPERVDYDKNFGLSPGLGQFDHIEDKYYNEEDFVQSSYIF